MPPMSTPSLHPNHMSLRNGEELRITRSGYRGHVGVGMRTVAIEAVRDLVASGGGLGPCGKEVLPILQEAGAQEQEWPRPGDALDALSEAVVELRAELHVLRDAQPLAPGERVGGRPTSRAWGLRHAGLCGWEARLRIVGNPRYGGCPLLAEATALRAELLALAEAASAAEARRRIG